jgi:ABC-type nitrate/sulfonate/bicarbonate transport system substrate-binding protein
MNRIHACTEKVVERISGLCIELAQPMRRAPGVKKSVSHIKSTRPRAAFPRVRIGFISLVDCAPLLVADALALFEKHGVEVELTREVGWATVREKILYRQLDAAHAIAGLALSLRLGLDGLACRAIAPFVINLHGNAITLSMDLWRRGVRDTATLHKLIRSTPQRLFTFAVVSRSASHNFLLRRWLRQGGTNPDRDVRMVVLPPTQMPGALTAGLIDGYCVGEPWNSVSIANGSGWCPGSSEDLAPGHPEKILLTTENFAESHPTTLSAVIRALHEACAYCDEPRNRPKVIEALVNSGYMRAERNLLKHSLIGPFDNGAGERRSAENFLIFHRNKANVPSVDKAEWLINAFVENGLIAPVDVSTARRAMSECWRPDLFHQAINPPRATATRRTTKRQLETVNA